MEKRTFIRITYPAITLAKVAELEAELEEILEGYGEHEVEITAISVSPPLPLEE